ncbi:response regulator transcription factor [Flagellimonas myxillae]|uniref:response regulator transcription factor n=1 Tax=Flagellimonas myxillae TaxID=2942214 RepID=UPI00201F8036|nr:LuxR C-terminal-related transcriptional regulator [Muricauda myxillae]MCL6267841.1 LuxR C-terminal-related transcriptional regulator [Muricauda myxillae]
MRILTALFFFLTSSLSMAQYHFYGQVAQENHGKSVYLSLVEDYRKSSRIYLEQIIRKSKVDSLGAFSFEGDNLLETNRVYRIHLDTCSEENNTQHFLGQCNSSQSVLFIANNKDTVQFPTSFGDQVLCTITSTNPNSSLLLDIAELKEEMIFDFMDFRSTANQRLNSEKWFGRLQAFGQESEEPLSELFIYDFLSDRRNETYAHYLKDVSTNGYYTQLLNRLKNTYPNTAFTQQFEAEINADQQLANFGSSRDWNWNQLLGLFLLLSLGLNLFLLVRQKSKGKKMKEELLQKLTPQEQKIVQHILEDKSNKEIASDLFISHSTIKTHINNLYKKLEVTSRQEIVSLFKN